jgi:Leu/Phe-tRNA-protein transferase
MQENRLDTQTGVLGDQQKPTFHLAQKGAVSNQRSEHEQKFNAYLPQRTQRYAEERPE